MLPSDDGFIWSTDLRLMDFMAAQEKTGLISPATKEV
jgi:hypothetical protein